MQLAILAQGRTSVGSKLPMPTADEFAAKYALQFQSTADRSPAAAELQKATAAAYVFF